MKGRKIYKGSQAYYERQNLIFDIIAYTLVTVIIGIVILVPGAIEYAVNTILR